jgi:hypothetical protein
MRADVERDMELIRNILLPVNADPTLNGSKFEVFDTSDFSGHTQEEIAYHIDLLFEVGFVKGLATLDAPAPAISRLTWEGHEFLGSVSDPSVWEKVKQQVAGIPTVAISVIWELAKAELKKKLNLSS